MQFDLVVAAKPVSVDDRNTAVLQPVDVLCCLVFVPQVMLPPPAAAAMEGLDMKKAMAILIAMDPNKAADVLTGAPCTTSLLQGLPNLQEIEPVNKCCCAQVQAQQGVTHSVQSQARRHTGCVSQE